MATLTVVISVKISLDLLFFFVRLIINLFPFVSRLCICPKSLAIANRSAGLLWRFFWGSNFWASIFSVLIGGGINSGNPFGPVGRMCAILEGMCVDSNSRSVSRIKRTQKRISRSHSGLSRRRGWMTPFQSAVIMSWYNFSPSSSL